ncbi:putative Serine/threonine-protein kinase Pkn1 [Hollandina sp. SP2]
MKVYHRFTAWVALVFASAGMGYGQTVSLEGAIAGTLMVEAAAGGGMVNINGNGVNQNLSIREGQTLRGFVRVEGGTFQMGSADGEDREKPVHTVTVQGFYMSKHEVTQKEWQEVMGTNLSYFKGSDLPVEMVSWYEAIEYCNKRSIKEGLTPAYQGSGDNMVCNFRANGYRLPTEAEWEYTAKEGNKGGLTYEYSGSNNLEAVGWYTDNSGSKTHTVGTKQPNTLGLYDMSGNVWEWCWDWYGSYSSGSQTDPRGPASGSHRVLRGGSWSYGARNLRSAYRYFNGPSNRRYNIGIRLVRS